MQRNSVQYRRVQCSSVQWCSVLRCSAVQCSAVHYTVLWYNTLHYTAQCCDIAASGSETRLQTSYYTTLNHTALNCRVKDTLACEEKVGLTLVSIRLERKTVTPYLNSVLQYWTRHFTMQCTAFQCSVI